MGNLSKSNEYRAIHGTYSDFKIVKTRNVAQFIIEVPIEQANEAISKFGLPEPNVEKWVAIALLNENHIQRDESATKAIQMAGMLCSEPKFGEFLRDAVGLPEVVPDNPNTIADALRLMLGVQSRTEMHDSPDTVMAFNRIRGEYNQWLMNENTL